MKSLQANVSTDILFINGLSCGDGTEGDFLKQLGSFLGKSYTIHRPDLTKLDRSSTRAAIEGIKAQFTHLENPIVIGFSLGGLWATFLAREGFTDRVIAISPALPSNWLQIDPLRLKIFGKSLILGKSFRFSEEIGRDVLMEKVPDEVTRECSKHFVDEPASLIREYAFMRDYTKLSVKDITHLRANVKGFIITGRSDRMCKASMQTKLSELIGFPQLILECGHTPQLAGDFNQMLIMKRIAHFIKAQDPSYLNELYEECHNIA